MYLHSYLQSIGFSKISYQKDLQYILNLVRSNPTNKTVKKESEFLQVESYKDFFESDIISIGITLVGEYDNNSNFYMKYYFPHVTYIGEKPYYLKNNLSVIINKRIDTDAYTCMCDNGLMGLPIIFYLNNSFWYNNYYDKNKELKLDVNIKLSALSKHGKVILPSLKKTLSQLRKENKELQRKENLISDAKKGDRKAIETLTIDDIDMYADISQRIRKEDLYTIVENTFIPYGSESDIYSIVADILDIKLFINEYTNEQVYYLRLNCNNITIDLCINKKDLIGQPDIMRRFKGIIWLQGIIMP